MHNQKIRANLFDTLRRNRALRGLAGLATATAALACTLAPAYASSQSGTVTNVAFVGGTNGRFLFWVSGTKTGTVPSCDCCSRWEVAAGDAYGQALVSIIMTAYAAGKQVSISGLGTPACHPGTNDSELVGFAQSN